MTRKKLLFVAGCGLFFMAACQSPKDQLARKWQVDGLENPFRDSMMTIQEKSIDTISVIDSNMAMYAGTTNLDSFKMIIKKQIKEQKEEQEKMAKEITMDFQKDGIMIQEGGGRTDSLKYTFADDGKYVTLKAKTPPPGMPDRSDTLFVDKLSSSELRFRVSQGGGRPLFINMKPAGGKKAEEKKEEKK
jgi:hypothetical protein